MALMFEGGYMSRKPRWATEERICEWCGKKYFPKVANQKTCSKECSYLREAKMKRERMKGYWQTYKRKPKEEKKPTQATQGRHLRSKGERIEEAETKMSRKQNMEELARIANLSNGDYGKWVAQNDNGRTKK